MFHHRLLTAVTAALGLLLWLPALSLAQPPGTMNPLPRLSAPGYYPGYYYSNYNTGYYYSNYYPQLYPYDRGYYRSYGSGVYYPEYPGPGSPAGRYPPTYAVSPARDGTTALLEVRVPTADAEVWVEGKKTSTTGTNRRYVSPPLTPGHKYAYEIRVRWSEGGREVSQTREVTVRAGERVAVDFTAPPKE